jgi:uncharacterized membrane protein YraQ (UPF0718 family)
VAIKYFVPDRLFFKFLPKNPFARRLYLSSLGFLLPVCECGNLPFSRGLLQKGVKPADTLAFLLGAPILNPITITTTVIAFGFDTTIVFARIIGGVVIANLISWIMSRHSEKDLLTDSFKAMCVSEPEVSSRLRRATYDVRHELGVMMPPLVIGAMIAGLTQVLIPRDVLTSLGGHAVVSILIMIILAFVVSICASVDAFFALSYANIFTPGAIVAFLTFGPMIDIKMLSLMRTTYKPKVLMEMTFLVFIFTFFLGLVVNYAF